MAQHLGYYNDPRDIRELASMTPREIVGHYRKGLGAFHEVSSWHPFGLQGLHPVKSGGKTYYVRKTIDKKYPDSPDNFIDIYVK